MIIDPQVDFISGALPVPEADRVMNSLALHIKKKSSEYEHIVVTADRHPFNHCSFVDAGGIWPRHCVSDSIGAAIWQPVIDAIYESNAGVSILYKGEDAKKEEYSIFKNDKSANLFMNVIREKSIGNIEICGLAGDVCVKDTISDGIKVLDKSMFKILTKYSPSLDGGKALNELILKTELLCDR